MDDEEDNTEKKILLIELSLSFLSFFVIFCHFVIFVIFCHFLSFFVIFCHFLAFFVIFVIFVI